MVRRFLYLLLSSGPSTETVTHSPEGRDKTCECETEELERRLAVNRFVAMASPGLSSSLASDCHNLKIRSTLRDSHTFGLTARSFLSGGSNVNLSGVSVSEPLIRCVLVG